MWPEIVAVVAVGRIVAAAAADADVKCSAAESAGDWRCYLLDAALCAMAFSATWSSLTTTTTTNVVSGVLATAAFAAR